LWISFRLAQLPSHLNNAAPSKKIQHIRRWDVLQIGYLKQTECFMLLLKSPIDGPCITLTRTRKISKTVFATHPYNTQPNAQMSARLSTALPRACSEVTGAIENTEVTDFSMAENA
jgi:hypothetical protein